MSILLDALKKSEEQRQLGKVPGIHSPAGQVAPPRSARQRLAPVLLLVVSVVALAWFGWRQLQPSPSEQLPVSEGAPVVSDEVADAPGAMVTASESNAPPASDESPARPVASRRTPVEALAAEDAGRPPAPVAASEQNPEPRKSRVNESFTAFEAAQQAAAAPPTATAAAPEPVNNEAPVSPAAQAAATQRAPAESRATEPISYWELPQGIRDNLPELRITVLVYSESPQDRFVLVGGQRLVEKDQYQEGVVLEEIRREGAVFLFRNYRFLVEG
jgi:general secretion pathway protein B